MLICDNVRRTILLIVNNETDNPCLHRVPKRQPVGVHVEDGLYRIITAGLVDSSEKINK